MVVREVPRSDCRFLEPFREDERRNIYTTTVHERDDPHHQAGPNDFSPGVAREIELPTIVVEALYRVVESHDSRGTALTGTPEEVVRSLETFRPVTIVGCGFEAVGLIPDLLADLTIHDATIVASRPRDTEGVITTDTEIDAVGVPVIWD